MCFGLYGCATDARQASALQVEQLTSQETVAGERVWSAPELQVRRFRIQFYGYDTVDYRLTAMQVDPTHGAVAYRLSIDANYGSNSPRGYQSAKTPDGVLTPLSQLRHEALRCQLFGNMSSACLYRDRAALELNAAALQAARRDGMALTLGASDKDYERIDLPADYVDGFLRAVERPPINQ